MHRHLAARATALCLATGVLACASDDPSPSGPPADALGTATYQGIYKDPVRLAAGRYEGEPFQPGAASRPTLTLLDEPRAAGDLDGDGVDESLVLLAENSGGSGVFVYLAVVGWRAGEPENLATGLLGDRVEVISLTAQHGLIHVELRERRTATSSSPVSLRLALVEGALVDPALKDGDTELSSRGLLVWGHEVRSFTECGSDTAAWFVDATDGGVRTAYEALATEPYQPLLFEVVGTYGPAPETGFGADYGRMLTIREVIDATTGDCD